MKYVFSLTSRPFYPREKGIPYLQNRRYVRASKPWEREKSSFETLHSACIAVAVQSELSQFIYKVELRSPDSGFLFLNI
jgi:hypothetical protein